MLIERRLGSDLSAGQTVTLRSSNESNGKGLTISTHNKPPKTARKEAAGSIGIGTRE